MPLLYARKEVFNWLKQGKKTIDIRKGTPRKGDIVVFQSGPHILRYEIVKKEFGQLDQVLRLDNFKQVIPSAQELSEAVDYLWRIYGVCDGVFTAYYIAPLTNFEKS